MVLRKKAKVVAEPKPEPKPEPKVKVKTREEMLAENPNLRLPK